MDAEIIAVVTSVTRGHVDQVVTEYRRIIEAQNKIITHLHAERRASETRIAALETERESLVETVNILGDDETMWAIEEVRGQESA